MSYKKNTYSSHEEYINEYVLVALDEEADNYDVDTIAAIMLRWENSVLIERDDVEFFEVVSANPA